MDEGYFDFHSASEGDGDFSKKTICPHCKKSIPEEATMCLFCGGEVVSDKRSPWIAWVAVAIIIAFIALVLFY